MPRKPAHEQFDTLKAIQERAFDLFGRYGYEGVSVGDIAKAAKLSKGALYWHFRGKGELYLDCLKRYIFDAIRAEQDGVKGILALFQGLMHLVQDPRVVNGIGGYWLIPSRPETAPLIAAQHAFEAESVAALSAVLKRAQAQGHIDLGREHDQMARAIISLVESVVLPLRKMSPEEVRGIVGILARTLFRAYAKGANINALTKLI
jgi:TetR/AcrR family acrAB operon transcriptional repressor